MKLYTKQGDKGLTRLGNGTQVGKDDLIIEALGTIDELNSTLGYAVGNHKVDKKLLQSIQHYLFNIGAELCLSKAEYTSIEDDIKYLEERIDYYQADTPPLKQFILPGGSPSGSWLFFSATVCRRAERAVIRELNHRKGQELPVNMSIVIFLNRLSDLLFAMARWENHAHSTPDVLWNSPVKRG